MLVSMNFSLQGIVQFGMAKENRAKADMLAFSFHAGFCAAGAAMIYALQHVLASVFGKPEFTELGFYLPLLIGANIFRYFVLRFFQRDYRYKEYFWVESLYFGIITVFILYRFFTTRLITVHESVLVYSIAEIAASLTGFLIIRKELKFTVKGGPTVREYINFSVPMALHSLVTSVPRRLDVVLAKLFFSFELIGIYSAAKTLFRVFEEVGFAAQALVYSATRKSMNRSDRKGILSLLVKGTSFMFVGFAACVLILNLGLTDMLVRLLPDKYAEASAMFKLLAPMALFLPFYTMNVHIISEGKTRLVLRYAIEGMLFFAAIYAVLAYFDLPEYMPFGFGGFLFYYGIRCYLYTRKEYGYSVGKIFSALPDSINFIKDKLSKK